MVSFKEEMIEEIDTLDQADREVVCGTLFHTVNWFREVRFLLTIVCVVLFIWRYIPNVKVDLTQFFGRRTNCATLDRFRVTRMANGKRQIQVENFFE